MGPRPGPRSCSNRPRPRQLRARSIGEPDCACVARILPHVRFAAVKARPNMGRDRRSFRSFRPAATRTMRQRSAPRSCSNRPSRDSYGRDPSVARLRMSSRRVLPPSNVAAKARPSRWRSSIISFIPRGGNAHYASEVCPAFMLQSTEPRQQLPPSRRTFPRQQAARRRERAPTWSQTPVIPPCELRAR
jgi:hypothetical protein